MNTPTNWRQQLTDLGGYENEMLGVPAGGVRKMVDEIERLRAKLAEITSEQLETRRKHREDYEALHDAVTERNELRAKLAALEGYGSMLSPDQLTLLKLLKAVEWSDHHYDPAHSHSFSCPICGGASREGDLRNIQQDFGHREGCTMNHHIKALAVKQALHDGTTEGRRAGGFGNGESKMKIAWLVFDDEYPHLPAAFHYTKPDYWSGRLVQIVYCEIIE